MYEQLVFTFRDSIEVEYHWRGIYGRKGEKRSAKAGLTSEAVKKNNQRIREKEMRRLIKANFEKNDYWCCLKYPEGSRKKTVEVKEDMKKFLRKLRSWYKKAGACLKFIYRIEISESGGVHIHTLINRIHGSMEKISELWSEITKTGKGYVDFKLLYEQGDYKELAEYIVKRPKKGDRDYEQLCLFPVEERKEYLKVSTSRNLVRVEPERRRYSHWTMRKILTDGPVPTPGYFIEKDSVVQGVNEVTGMSFLYYTEKLIEKPANPVNDIYGGHFRRKNKRKRKNGMKS